MQCGWTTDVSDKVNIGTSHQSYCWTPTCPLNIIAELNISGGESGAIDALKSTY